MVDQSIFNEVMELRNQGLTDNVVIAEMSKRGYVMEDIQAALAQADSMYGSFAQDNSGMAGGMNGSMPRMQAQAERQVKSSVGDDNIYDRIEEITENMIDEKWDELIAEVKKIIQWKEKVEEKQNKLVSDVDKMKEDFKTLHGGVLGKLEEYDERMQDVGTELKAVGRVFKDVVPEFVENVKELRSLKEEWKRER
ncbi:hypothetical protein HYU21_04555 [Candidatus Woesearchaeota archaeon]|nr:hypothetical protein [Candidatus Woesearchaeota archaeon]